MTGTLKILGALVSLSLLLTNPCASRSGITLEQLMSVPFPSELTADSSGTKLAWVFNSRGARNIWVAEAPEFKAHPLTRYMADDGQEITGLQWAPDGRAVVYVRGSNANKQGEYPNPLSDPRGAEQTIFLVSLGGGEPRRLAEGHSPSVAPSGDRLAYLKKGQLWWMPVDGEEKQAQQVRARGECTSPVWSPDGGALAFVSRRDDHSFVSIYEIATGTLRYLDPSVDHDQYATWSPDSRQIAFVRWPESRTLALFGPKRSALPWSIRVADVSTGLSREIWRAKEGTGSVFHEIEAQGQLMWCDGDHIVFPWEGDGWVHLYVIPSQGGEPVLLTPGKFEVEHVFPGPDRKTIFYSSNQEDPDRRHLWKTSINEGIPVAVTRGQGLEWAPVALAGGYIAYMRSDARNPARVALLAGGNTRDLAPETIPADFPAHELVEPQPVIFEAVDGMRIHAQLFLPRNDTPKMRRPAIIFVHGGSRRQMLLGWHPMYYYHNAYAMNEYLASQGYIVLSINYRSGTGYGMEFREALNYGAVGASEFNDVLGAAMYLKRRADVDPEHIGLWGGSYGGYLTALGLARASDLFAAGVDLHGVHDWRTETKVSRPSDSWEVQQIALRLAYDSSPLAHMSTWRSPVLLIHGDDDRNVNFSQTVMLVEALRQQKVGFEQLVFPDEVHDFLTHKHWLDAYRAAVDFFHRRLGRPRTSLE
jgi:dipeptidyl aminopeptidase/acylaminoacyl peptidase